MFLVASHRDTHDSTEYLWPKEAKPWETVCAHPCDGVKTGSVLTGAEMTSVGLRLAFLLHLRWEGDICSRWLCVRVHDFFVQFTDNLTGGEERCEGLAGVRRGRPLGLLTGTCFHLNRISAKPFWELSGSRALGIAILGMSRTHSHFAQSCAILFPHHGLRF